jgi:tetratricopeptide (TPR) repeat protein
MALLLLWVGTATAQPGVDEKLALQFFQNKEYEQAAELYQRIYQRDPSPFYYNYYLDCLFELQDYAKAKSFVRQVAKANPKDPKYEIEEAYVLERSGSEDKAAKSYEKVIKERNENRQMIIDVKDAFLVRGLNDYALQTLQKGKKVVKDPPLNMELADVYFKIGNYSAMIDEYLDLVVEDDKYIVPVQSKLQQIISNPDQENLSEALRLNLLERTQKYPNKTVYAELLYWYSIQKKDFELAIIQAKALDRQFNEGGSRLFNLGNILLSNQSYTLAVEAYQYVIDLGNESMFAQSAGIQILQARFMKITAEKNYQESELVALKKDYLSELDHYGRNGSTVSLMVNLAHLQAFYLNEMDDGIALLQQVDQLPSVPADMRSAAKLQLGDMMLFSGQKWAASLLYKQVEKEFKHDAIGYEAKFKAAQFYYFVGEMEWAKSQLKVLSGATSKLIANNSLQLYLLITENISEDSTYDALGIYAKADLLHFQKQLQQANFTLDTLIAIFPNHPVLDDAYYKKALIAMDLKAYLHADSLYNKVFELYPYSALADNFLIERARLNDGLLQNKKLAKLLYQQILLDYPGSLFTVEARKRYRELEAESK